MRFVPPRCPNTKCPRHSTPRPGFCVARGWYRVKCRLERVPRFRCRTCRRSFSRQTFRHDFRDKRPETNAPLFTMLTSGVGLRQAARTLGLDIRAVQQKLAKMGATCAGLLDNVASRVPGPLSVAIGKETSTAGPASRPLTVPLAVERASGFLLGYGAAHRGEPPTDRKHRPSRALASGTRMPPDRTRACVDRVVAMVARKVAASAIVQVHTDDEAGYASILRRRLDGRLHHVQTARSRPIDGANPLAPLYRMIAMGRDNCGRLRHRSWLATKKREPLVAQLHLFAAYVNLGRRRFNRDAADCTPAQTLGLLPRRLRPEEILGWRQDWRRRSCHPLDPSGRRCFTAAMPA